MNISNDEEIWVFHSEVLVVVIQDMMDSGVSTLPDARAKLHQHLLALPLTQRLSQAKRVNRLTYVTSPIAFNVEERGSRPSCLDY